MDDNFKGSPYRRHTDEEAGCSKLGCDSDDEGTFSIPRTKDAPIVRLKRWRAYRIWRVIGLYILVSKKGLL
ncbi:hypothetical protein CISIN_1g045179mg [Citrus sinensis]|uniref:Uncharacterized protein n=1 Tax=Citrus sinensis TaxID=2711 RepID=A0A067FES4_CITSI|nr:hypothetical protein CISIN_1g045179mg [Citrus sinensis]